MTFMYDSEYASTWIKNEESGKDFYRIDYLYPFLEKFFRELPENLTVLDVGCGWGTIIRYLKKNHQYHGVDPVNEFLGHIKLKYPWRDMKLSTGSLPDKIFIEEKFDVVVCSMALHTVGDLITSIKTLVSKVKSGGTLLIIDFNDSSEQLLKKTFKRIDLSKKDHVQGIITLGSGIPVYSDIYFHKEKDFESMLAKEGSFEKGYLGPIFVSYLFKKR